MTTEYRVRAHGLAIRLGQKIDIRIVDPVVDPIDSRSNFLVLKRHIRSDAIGLQQIAGGHPPGHAAFADLAGSFCVLGLFPRPPKTVSQLLEQLLAFRTAFQTDRPQRLWPQDRSTGANQFVHLLQAPSDSTRWSGRTSTRYSMPEGSASRPFSTVRLESNSSSLSTS